MRDQEKVEAILASIEMPPYVVDVRLSLGEDHDGDPAATFMVIVEDEVTQAQDLLQYTQPVRRAINQAMYQSDLVYWPLVRFRSRSEQAEFDQLDAA